MKHLVVGSLLLITACGGSKKPEAAPEAGSATAAPPAATDPGAVESQRSGEAQSFPSSLANIHPAPGGSLTFASAPAPSCDPGPSFDLKASEQAAGAVIAALELIKTARPSTIPAWFAAPAGYQVPPARVVGDPTNDVAPMVVLVTTTGAGWLYLVQGDTQLSFCLHAHGDAFEVAQLGDK